MANTDLDLGNSATAANNLKLRADGAGGGSICNGAGTELVKVPAGGVPAFRAYATGVTSVTSSWTKIALAGESYDTAAAFATDKFAPLVAGYYQINGKIEFSSASYAVGAVIYRGGSQHSRGGNLVGSSAVVSDIVYLDGTGTGASGYVELYGYSGTTQNNAATDSSYTYFSGILIKAA